MSRDPAGGRPLRVLVAVPQGAESPGPRYRVFQFLPALAAAGCDVRVLALQGDAETRRNMQAVASRGHAAQRLRTYVALQRFQVRLIREASAADRVLVYRLPISWWARRSLARWHERIVFDFDDALFAAEAEGGGVVAAVRQRVLRNGLLNAFAVSGTIVTSNRYNAAFVASVGREASVLPTCVDTNGLRWRGRRELGAQRPVIGWIGSPSTASSLPLVEDALETIASRHEVAIRLVGAGRNPFRRIDAEVRAWRAETESAELDAFDIGLMPMPDTAWTRGKAALKALQYGAAGVPAVVSWTPTNEEILGTDHGALLCRTPAEWVSAIDRLICSGDVREDLGRRGRTMVARRYALSVVAPRFVELVAGLGPGSPGRREAPGP